MLSYGYLKFGETLKSLDTLTKGINEINNIKLLKERANLFQKLGKYEEAISDYNKIALRKDNKDQNEILICRGRCYINLKKYDKAVKDFTSVIESKKCSSNVYIISA